MNLEEIQMGLHQRGLGRVNNGILALAAPTIWVHVRPAAEAAIPIGASKMGGQPDLPAGVEWTAWHEPMAFQFNLAEIAPFDDERVLPSSGLHSFFYETDGEPLYTELWGQPHPTRLEDYPPAPDPRSWLVLYFPDEPSTFSRRATPATVNEFGRFPACDVRFSVELSLPDEDAPEVQSLGLTDAERNALIDFLYVDPAPNRSTGGDLGNRLLGYPYNLGGSTFVQCEYASRNIRDILPYEIEPEQAQAIERRWRLLFQVDSGEALQMDWGGGGVLHYCIEREALARRDFSRV